MLELGIEVPLESDGGALIARRSVSHVESQALGLSHERVGELTVLHGFGYDWAVSHHWWCDRVTSISI